MKETIKDDDNALYIVRIIRKITNMFGPKDAFYADAILNYNGKIGLLTMTPKDKTDSVIVSTVGFSRVNMGKYKAEIFLKLPADALIEEVFESPKFIDKAIIKSDYKEAILTLQNADDLVVRFDYIDTVYRTITPDYEHIIQLTRVGSISDPEGEDIHIFGLEFDYIDDKYINSDRLSTKEIIDSINEAKPTNKVKVED